MKKAILFNFRADKDHRKIYVERSFDAHPDLVWQAWTDPQILDRWWAPRPWQSRTVDMDFREGGRWFYGMFSPEGEATHWCMTNYNTITSKKGFTSKDSFCNEKGEVNRDLPAMQWDTRFSQSANGTVVNVTLSFEKLEHLEQIIDMGFKEGFAQGLEQLDEWLDGQNN